MSMWLTVNLVGPISLVIVPGLTGMYGSPVMSANQTCGPYVYMRAAEGFRSLYTFMRACSKEGLPVICAKDYSYLKATIGSTRIARRAGM